MLLTKRRNGKPEYALQEFRAASVGRHLDSWFLKSTQSSHGYQRPSLIDRLVSRHRENTVNYLIKAGVFYEISKVQGGRAFKR